MLLKQLKNVLKKILNIIKQSASRTHEYSSARVTSYIILTLIILMTLYFIIVGIYIVVADKTTIIPNEMVVVYGMLLTHQLTLLGINKYHETKQKQKQK